jgi:hypothetical protein
MYGIGYVFTWNYVHPYTLPQILAAVEVARMARSSLRGWFVYRSGVVGDMRDRWALDRSTKRLKPVLPPAPAPQAAEASGSEGNPGSGSGAAPSNVYTKCTVPGTVAITFDDGARALHRYLCHFNYVLYYPQARICLQMICWTCSTHVEQRQLCLWYD